MTETTTTEHIDVGRELAEFVATTPSPSTPSEIREHTKLCILDTLGVTLAASGLAPGVREINDLVVEMGGDAESTVVSFGGRLPAATAAFVNGAMAHALDYDDLQHDLALHLSTSTVPAGLALAEREGASGETLLAAVALGNEVALRMGHSVVWNYDWFTTPLFGFFSATATPSRILGLSATQTYDALSWASCQAAGSLQMRLAPGSNVAAYYSSWPSKAGVFSALLAQRDIAATVDAFEGREGFYKLYFANDYDRAALTKGLGHDFHGLEISFKPWPACGGMHAPIDATIQLVSEHDIRSAEIERIIVRVSGGMAAFCEPLEVRRRPTTMMDAKVSLPFNIAVAATHGGIPLSVHSERGRTDETVLGLAAKVEPIEDPALADGTCLPPVEVEITVADGTTFTRRLAYPYGRAPERPMSEAEIVAKFEDCATYAARPLAPGAVERITDMVMNLERLPDVRALGRELIGK